MKLFILRHGEATFDAPSDRLRPLTERGKSECLRQVGQCKAELSGVDRIWVSELLRAQQTAEIVASALDLPVESKRFLSPDTDPARVLRELEKHAADQNLLLVSHQPLVGCLVSLLCAGHVYEAHPFDTAELVCLEAEMPGAGLAQMKANWRAQV